MKRFLLGIAIFSILPVAALYSQELGRDISRAFASGDIDIISGNMANKVELSIDGERTQVTGPQAVERISRFMANLAWPKFTIVHKSGRDNAGFIIGNLKSNKTTYRVNISYDRVENKDVIRTIRIEQTDD